MKVFAEHARALDPTPTQEIAPLLPKLRIPVAVVWGRRDPFQKPKYGERLVKDIPTAEVTWIDEASHYSPADAPDQVAPALGRLLDQAAREYRYWRDRGPDILVFRSSSSPLDQVSDCLMRVQIRSSYATEAIGR